MATAKTKKKTVKKSSPKKSTAKKTVTTTKVGTQNTKVFAGFFARKFDPNENILTIFKTPKIYGAIVGELVGTMLLAIFLLTLGVQPLYIIFGTIAITIAVFALSGANLNPFITVGMMASRRMSAIRGVLYILAQVLGAWLGLLIINSFRLGSGTSIELPQMTAITGETFWAVTLIELFGAIFIGFFFARALRYKKNVATFALTVTGGITFAIIFGIVVSQSYFEMTNSFIFNPAIALMYQILPSSAASFGALMGNVMMALLAYVIFPMIGGVIGFYLADFASKLAGEKCDCGYCKDCK